MLAKLLVLRTKYISDRNFILILSVFVGLATGLAALVIKTCVHFIQNLLSGLFTQSQFNFLYFLFPAVGIGIVIFFVKYINKNPIGHGIPSVLYAISKKKARISPHNLYSSVVASSLTVGFGGSVGLEGPTVATGAAIGSNIGKFFKLEYKQIVLLLGCACAGAMASIFKAPVAGIVFALEVIMLDLTMSSLVPLLVSSVTAVLVSYEFTGQNFLYTFKIEQPFILHDLPFYIILGVFAGFMSVYFARMYMFIAEKFEKIKNEYLRWMIGGAILGVLIFFLPPLYGEGYQVINQSLTGDFSFLFTNTIFESLENKVFFVVLFFLLILIFKVVATSVTFGSGGVGGIFAPTLFMGASTGLFFAKFVNYFDNRLVESNFALVGMAGLIAGVIHAPLMSIFLIAEITGGYILFVPLMIVATISYATVRIFETNSVYTYQLAKRGELMTHHKDKAVFLLMNLENLIEKDFEIVYPDQNLEDLVNSVSKSKRNVFPVVDEKNHLVGILTLNDIRDVMFRPELYHKIKIRDIMYFPSVHVSFYDSLEIIAEKIETSGRYNVPVLRNGEYIGFVSRATIFSSYRKMLKYFSEH